MEKDKINNEESKVVSFKDSFIANLIDMVVIFILSLIILLVFDKIILRILGYKLITEYTVIMLVIILAIILVLYPTYMECKKGATIGKKFLKIRIVETDKTDKINEVDAKDEVDTKVDAKEEIDKEVDAKEDTIDKE